MVRKWAGQDFPWTELAIYLSWFASETGVTRRWRGGFLKLGMILEDESHLYLALQPRSSVPQWTFAKLVDFTDYNKFYDVLWQVYRTSGVSFH